VIGGASVATEGNNGTVLRASYSPFTHNDPTKLLTNPKTSTFLDFDVSTHVFARRCTFHSADTKKRPERAVIIPYFSRHINTMVNGERVA